MSDSLQNEVPGSPLAETGQGTSGMVWLVGAGPGDPGLLTLKGREALDAADTVVYDRLVSEEILLTVPASARLINAGKPPGNHPLPQEEINRILIEEAGQGRRVVRLKGGDPFLFGRGGEELLALAEAGVPCCMVPGISSALAVPACAGIPVTHRGVSAGLHVIAWHGRDDGKPTEETLRALAAAGGTLVILMGGAALAEIGERLGRAGFDPDTPAMLIESGSTPRQRTRTLSLARLGEWQAAGPPAPPMLVVVGAVCSLAEQMIAAATAGGQARDDRLRGLRLVVPLPEPRNEESCREINARGGTGIPFPCVKTIPRETGVWLKEIPGEEISGVWLVFTSATGVDYFFDGAFEAGRDLRSFSRCRLAAVGPATVEALARRNIHADFAPKVFNGRALGEGLSHCMARGELAYLIGAGQKTPALGETLLEQGIPFRDLAIYDTIPAQGGAIARAIIEAGQFDGVLFTSPSAVAAFAAAFRAENRSGVQALCIGETTGGAARKLGMKVHIAEESSMQGLYRLAAVTLSRKTG